MTFEQFMKEYPHWNIVDEHLAKIVWNARQPEIDELKRKCKILIDKGLELSKRISELESDNEELRHILRNNL